MLSSKWVTISLYKTSQNNTILLFCDVLGDIMHYYALLKCLGIKIFELFFNYIYNIKKLFGA